ncbi:alpha/beta hydrolase family protein [Rasiella sp. SM2506]|uniref:alpha/beta hydrolase family protein n=1 Tax=Rasiella sp. SM2506 TaxID=3423914 RepID=UPI003D7BC51E
MKIKLLLVCITLSTSLFAQDGIKLNQKDISVSAFIDGTILTPETSGKSPLVILIADSGPTDRNGNQQMMTNNHLKFLAEGLYTKGIATFRYDKRIIKQMKDRTINEQSIRFDDFIKDAQDIVAYFKRSDAFSKIIVLGHGQGSTVGMVAAQNGVDGYISIAGPGRSIDNVIVEQLSQQAPGLKDNARTAFDELAANGSTQNYSEGLASIFRPSIQPFIRSWMRYDPALEIAKLDIPVLIIAGDKDIQVLPSEGEVLRMAKPDATYTIIRNMNHPLKELKADDDDLVNQKSYNEPRRPVIPQLIEAVATFVKK